MNSSSPQTALPRSFPRSKFALLLIPLVLTLIVGELFFINQDNRRKATFEQRAGNILERLGTRTDSDSYVRQMVWDLFDSFRRQPRRFQQQISRKGLRNTDPELAIDLFFFDERGAITNVFPRDAANQWMFKQLFKGLRSQSATEKKAIRKQLEKMLTETLGNGKNLGYFSDNRSKLIKVNNPNQANDKNTFSWLCWDYVNPLGLLVFVRTIPEETNRFLQALRREKVTSLKGFSCGIGIPSQNSWHLEKRGMATTQCLETPMQVASICQKLNSLGLESMYAGEKFWTVRRGEDGRQFFAGFSLPRSLQTSSALWFRILIFLLWLAGIFLLEKWEAAFGSIRNLTVGLFALSALVPIGGMVLGTLILLDGRYDTMSNQVLGEEMEILKNLDQQFFGHRRKAKETILKAVRAMEPCRTSQEVASVAAPLLHSDLQARIELKAPDGTVVFTSDKGDGGFDSTIEVFFRNSLKRWAPWRLEEAPTSSRKKASDDFFNEGYLGLDFFPKYLHLFNSSGEKNFLLWDFFPRRHSFAAFVSVILRGEMVIADYFRYIRRHLTRRYSFIGHRIRVAGFHLETGSWSISPLPAKKELTSLILQTTFMGRPHSGHIRLGSRRYWYTVFPARELHRHCLVALFPDQAFTRHLGEIKQRIALGMLIALFSAIVLGAIVSRRLLQPVSDLQQGMAALQKRDFYYQIPITRKDELGELALAFNEMIHDLQDFDLAKGVQTALITQRFPVVPSYTIAGTTRFANDLGGDCLDCRMLSDGRMLFLIGDVAGHGVASALLMALVKAVITIWCEAPNPQLESLAVEIDQAVKEAGKNKRFISIFYGILDPRTNTLETVCCGQPFPALKKADQSIELIGEASYPLGIRRKSLQVRPARRPINPGDILVLYTDGLIESLLANGEMFDYKGLQKWLANTNETKASSILGDLTSFHHSFCPVIEDDVTILVISRTGSDS